MPSESKKTTPPSSANSSRLEKSSLHKSISLPILTEELPAEFECEAKYSEVDSYIELTTSEGKQKKFYILSELTAVDYDNLKKFYPYLAKKLRSGNKKGELILGTGTFSFVKLAKDEQGNFFAIREILSSEELSHSHCNPPPLRGKVLFDTKHEMKAHAFLKAKGADSSVILTEYVALLKTNDEKLQSFQVLPLAEGTVSLVINKLSYFSQAEKETLFQHLCSQLLDAVTILHQAGVAHNDLTPDNILLCLGKFKLSDLGAVSFWDEKLIVASTLKNLRYSAPYSRYIHPNADKDILKVSQRADLWSLGLIILTIWDEEMVKQFINDVLQQLKAPFFIRSDSDSCKGYYVIDGKHIYNDKPDSDKKEELPQTQSEAIIRIYKRELSSLFSSFSFLALPPLYQDFVKELLNPVANFEDMMVSLVKLSNTKLPESHKAVISPLFKKFITIPEEKLEPAELRLIKDKIKTLLNDCNSDSALNTKICTVLDTHAPADFAEYLLPCIEKLKPSYFSLLFWACIQPVDPRLNDLVGILERFCKGEGSYSTILEDLCNFETEDSIKNKMDLY